MSAVAAAAALVPEILAHSLPYIDKLLVLTEYPTTGHDYTMPQVLTHSLKTGATAEGSGS